MPDGLLNTPETLGTLPRYVLHYNAISRSAHSMSATAKKLTFMAMALLPLDLSSLSAAFTFTEFCKALGFEDGGKSYKIFTAAVEECMKTVISIETEKIVKGKKSWEKFTWFEYAKFNAETHVCTMQFSTKLAEYLLEFKKVYAKINLKDAGNLQSKYGLRIFELATSYSSLEGKDGNPTNAWYFERSVQEIRKLFGVPETAYPETRDFRKKVIEEPILEINNAEIGMKINTESVKQGRKLSAIRFNCKKTARKTTAKRGRKKKSETACQEELPELSPWAEDLRLEKELEHLKELYPDEFTALYVEELARPTFLPPEDSARMLAARAVALNKLKEKYGIKRL